MSAILDVTNDRPATAEPSGLLPIGTGAVASRCKSVGRWCPMAGDKPPTESDPSQPKLVEGEIVFDQKPIPFKDATIHVRLLDTGDADASAAEITRQTIRDISAEARREARVP